MNTDINIDKEAKRTVHEFVAGSEHLIAAVAALCHRIRAASRTGKGELTHDQARDIATQILDGTHCPKHGMAWEECCLGEVGLEIACKIIAALRGEDFSRFALAASPVEEKCPDKGEAIRRAAEKIVAYLALPDEAEPNDSTGSPTAYIEKIIESELKGVNPCE